MKFRILALGTRAHPGELGKDESVILQLAEATGSAPPVKDEDPRRYAWFRQVWVEDQNGDVVAVFKDNLGTLPGPVREWNFWLPDEDRSAGWTNHCYVLQFVCAGKGETIAEAWTHAIVRNDGRQVPEDFHLPEGLIAIPTSAERRVRATDIDVEVL